MQVRIKPPNLTDYQENILYSKKRFTTTQAGTKTGKTFSHIYWLFACAHAVTKEQAHKLSPHLRPAKDGNEYWWVAPVYAQAKIAFNRMQRRVAKLKGYALNKGELTITTPIGTIIRFKTARDPDNLYGEDVFACVFDEYTRSKQESWFALRSTLTATQGPCKLIGNFKGKANWGNQLSLKAQEPGSEYESFIVTAMDAVRAGLIPEEEIVQARKDMPKFMFLALYMAQGDIDNARLIEDDAIDDILTNKIDTSSLNKYITADIAGFGSDRFVLFVWHGWKIIDIKVFEKCGPEQVINIINGLAETHGVRNSNICYDADGVGFVGGFITGAKAFHNGSRPVKVEYEKQEFTNLKSQCYFHLARIINRGEIGTDVDLGEYWLDIMEELEVVKNRAHGTDGKLEVLRKVEIKEIIGRSPDFSDAMMMRSLFDLGHSFERSF